MSKFLTAQDVLRVPASGSAMAGFNCRVFGESERDTFQYQHEITDHSRRAGWDLASRMIADGKLFFVYNFHSLSCDGGYAFSYGGTWVCNTCHQSNLAKPWWKIKVQKDGTAWCCVGLDFENLQESDDVAFGESRDEAIKNYGLVMLAKERAQP